MVWVLVDLAVRSRLQLSLFWPWVKAQKTLERGRWGGERGVRSGLAQKQVLSQDCGMGSGRGELRVCGARSSLIRAEEAARHEPPKGQAGL